MKRKLLMMLILGISTLFISSENIFAQRKSVNGKEVTGTFRYEFTGKYKGNFNEIKIFALGGGKLKVQFDLIYPFNDTANVGQAVGEAEINGDTAIYSQSDGGMCKITIKFVKPGQIKVSQEQEGAGCGFGLNVSAQGIYRKVSSRKPKFTAGFTRITAEKWA